MADLTREQFQESLTDVLVVIKKLALHCQNFDEMAGLIELAVGTEVEKGNAAQLKILMNLVLPQQAAQPQGNRRA